ncbi:MAG: hypothetical protein AAF221_08700 [Pseudomonadota bacterium]
MRLLSISLAAICALWASAAAAQAPVPSEVGERTAQTSPDLAPLPEMTLTPAAPARQAGEILPFAPNFSKAPIPDQNAPTPLLDLTALPLPEQAPVFMPGADEKNNAGMNAPLEETGDQGLFQAAPQPPLDLVPQTVTTSQLSAKDLAGIGTLSLEQGGFGESLWADTSYSELLEALQSADASVKSPIIQRALRRLALSIAIMPGVSERGAWMLLKARLDLLARSGDLAGLHAFAARLPNDLAPKDILKLKASVALRADDWPMACAAATEGLRRAATRYWAGVRLACRAGQGNRSAVDLLLDTTDAGTMPPAQVRSAVDRLLEKTAPTSFVGARQAAPRERRAAAPTPLLAAISRLVDGPGQADEALDLLSLEPLSVASLAFAAEAPLGDRWPAVAALAYWGHFEGAEMLSYAISTPVNTRADASLGLAPGQLQRALSAPNSAAMAAQLSDLSAQSQFSGLPHIWTGAIGEAMAHVQPSEGLWPQAGMIAAHLAYAGYGANAAQWYDDLRARVTSSNVEEAQYIMEVWPWALAANEPGRVPFTSRLAELWLQTNGMDDKGLVLPKAKVMFAVLEGLGYDTGAALRVAVDDTLSPLPASLPQMDRAVSLGQTGLAILAGFEALGPQSTLQPDPVRVRAVIQNLRAIDQGALARAIAVEALLHAGVARSNGA